MITLDRVLARQTRAVIRKLLGRGSSSYGPPLRISTGPDGLQLEVVAPQGAVRYRQPGNLPATESIVVPLTLLDDCQSGRPGTVMLEQRGQEVTAQWTDGQIPQLVTYAAAEPSRVHEFPELPENWSNQPPELLAALHEAMDTTDPLSSRMMLGCIQLSGPKGRIAATDGRQVYLHEGDHFGWEDEVLVLANPVFGCQDLSQDQPLTVGITKNWLAVQVGAWTIALPRQIDGKFPDVDSVIPSADDAKATVCLAREDMTFLRHSLAKLRAEDGDLPVTIDLNGSVVVRCQPAGQPKPTELVLSNTTCQGEQVSFNASRARLMRALELGMDRLHFVGPQTCVLWTNGNRRYAWAPFPADDAIPASENAIRLASPTPAAQGADPGVVRRRRNRTASPANGERRPPDVQPRAAARTTRKRPHVDGKPAAGVDGLIQQAETVHLCLRQSLLRNRELLKALKQHRRQTRLVRTTLSSLKQLQGMGA